MVGGIPADSEGLGNPPLGMLLGVDGGPRSGRGVPAKELNQLATPGPMALATCGGVKGRDIHAGEGGAGGSPAPRPLRNLAAQCPAAANPLPRPRETYQSGMTLEGGGEL